MPEQTRVNVYTTPAAVWTRAFSRRVLPTDFVLGIVNTPVFTGTGTGTFRIDKPWPYDAYSFRVKITVAGNLGTAYAACSDDGGVTYGGSFLIADDSAIMLTTPRGYPIGVEGAFSGTGFLVNDTWSFQTSASPQFVDEIITACDYIDSFIGNRDNGGRYHLPLLRWPGSLGDVCAKFVRWNLLATIGVEEKGKDKLYRDERDWAQKWLDGVAKFLIHPDIVESDPHKNLPDIQLGEDKYGVIRNEYLVNPLARWLR